MDRRFGSSWRHALGMLMATTILAGGASVALAKDDGDAPTKTPIKHLVVIFQENVSFDHYFATYPVAANPDGEPRFVARDDTPTVNGLSGRLLTDNPNGANPIRLDRSQAVTCDNDHDYTDEQKSVDGGLLDKFTILSCSGTIGLNYYDGNTTTAMWNYAQHFALNQNSFGTTFGPSTPGALNLVSGQMHAIGQLVFINDAADDLNHGDATLSASTITGDADPIFDDCGAPDQAGFQAKGGADNHNIGDLLNAKHITWGWFQGGFAPTQPATFNPDGSVKTPAVCGATTTGHPGVDPGNPGDPVHAPIKAYSAHHEPFMYYDTDANTHHLPPSSEAMVGKTDQAKHQYDLSLFFDAMEDNRLPAVSFIKAPRAEDGHPGNSDPLSEQLFVVDLVNKLQKSPEWKETAVMILWDDSDGWYDHVTGPIVNKSNAVTDALTGNDCGTPAPTAYLGRCGYGPRLPLLVVSPWAKRNFVDSTLTDQSSPIRFVEDNWNVGRIDDLDHPGGTPEGQQAFDAIAGSLLNMFDFDDPPHLDPVILNPITGEVVDGD